MAIHKYTPHSFTSRVKLGLVDYVLKSRPTMSILLFAAWFGFLSYLQVLVRTTYKPLSNFMLNLRVPIYVDGVWVNLLGFILPAFISVVMSIWLVRKHYSWPKYSHVIILLISTLTAISFFIVDLQPTINGYGSGTNFFAWAIVFFYVFFYVLVKDYSLQVKYFAFILGYLVGVSSDLGSAPWYIGTQTFGGYGLVDADIIFPVALFLGIWIAEIIVAKMEQAHRPT